MILLANTLGALAYILHMVLMLALILVIARAVISWVNPDPSNPIVRFLQTSTDPMLRPLQKYIPLVGGGIDLTPIFLIFLIYFLDFALVQSLADYAAQLRRAALMG
ncbi:YggT family protein [Oligoflexia bacterium]|nr:YggT family protein [Oligoflexia bacterium]